MYNAKFTVYGSSSNDIDYSNYHVVDTREDWEYAGVSSRPEKLKRALEHTDYRITASKNVKSAEFVEAVCSVIIAGLHIAFLILLAVVGMVIYVKLSPLLPDTIVVAPKTPYILPDRVKTALSASSGAAGDRASSIVASVNVPSITRAVSQPAVTHNVKQAQVAIGAIQVALAKAKRDADALIAVVNEALQTNGATEAPAAKGPAPRYPWRATKAGVASMMTNAVDSIAAVFNIVKSIHVGILYETIFHIWPVNLASRLLALQSRLGKNLEMLGVVFKE